MKFRFVVLVGALALLLGSACGRGGPPDVAARVGGTAVPSADVERLTRQWLRSSARVENDAAVRTPVSRKEAARNALTYLIRLTALQHLARELAVNADAPSDDVERVAAETPADDLVASGWSHTDFLETYRAARLSRAIATQLFPDVPVGDGELRQDYDRQPGGTSPSWDARVAIAYFDADGPARQLADRVRGGTPFVAGAQALGAREATSLEHVTPTTPLPAPVLKAVAEATIGQVSAPLETGGGFVAFVVETRDQRAPRSFDEAKADLRARRVDQERQRRFMDWFDDRLGTERIEIAQYYGRWDSTHRLVI
jgi:hypothetical protein